MAAVAYAIGAFAAPVARADDGATLDLYSPAVAPGGGFALDRPARRSHLTPSVRLDLDYANDPLVFEVTTGRAEAEHASLVGHQLTSHLGLALGLGDRFLVYGAWPVHLVMEGVPLGNEPTATGFGSGDLALGGRVDIQDGHAALQITLTLPTGEDGDGVAAVAGDASATVEPEVIGEIEAGPVRIVANLGVRLRKDIVLAGVSFGDALTYGLGLVVPFAPDVFELEAEVHGSSRLDDVGARGSSPVEALAGPRVKFAHAWTVGAAAGLGLTRGYGAPDARVVVLAGWTGEALTRPATEPATEPEPATPEPEPKPEPPPAPLEPEAQDGLASLGVDPATADSDGDGVSDLDDTCPDLPGRGAGGCPQYIAYDHERGEILLRAPVTFTEGAGAPRRSAEKVLEEIAWFLRARMDMHVRFEVHTGAAPDRERALAISIMRAVGAAGWVVEHGIARDRLEAYGCGANRPLVPPGHPRARDNERVEVHVLLPLPPRGRRSSLGCGAGEIPEPPAPVALTQLDAGTSAARAPTAGAPAAAMTGAALAAALAQSPKADHDGDTVRNEIDACAMAPGPTARKGCPVGHRVEPGAARFEFKKRIRFSANAPQLDPGSEPWVAELAATLRANPGMKVRVEVHVHQQPDAATSVDLTRRRAAALRARLVSMGVTESRVAAFGCGHAHPIAPNNVPWGQKKNERIELVVLDPAPASGVASSAGCAAAE
jgi:outer membrane protein OmpA-like peptidoglycan-associated protein